MNKPTVIILSAGASSRMYPLSSQYHKAFLQLHGATLISHTVANLAKNGYENIILVTSENQQTDLVHQLAENSPANIEIVIQKEATGMGDALLLTKHLLPEKFLIVFPYHTQISGILDQLLDADSDVAITAVQTDAPWMFGILNIENDKATSLVEKPDKGKEPSNIKIQGAYLLNKHFIEILEKTKSNQYSFETALNELMHTQPVAIVKLKNDLPSLKYPWHLFDLQNDFFQNQTSFIDPSALVAKTAILDESRGPILISKGAKIGDFTKIVGPCFIGENALVGDYSFIRHSNIENQATIGANTEVVRSIIMPQSNVHFSYVADSIIGPQVKIGAGLLTANKRLDRKNILVPVKDEKIDSERNNLGVIIGTKANLGIGVKTMPGVIIPDQAQIMPGEIVYQKGKE